MGIRRFQGSLEEPLMLTLSKSGQEGVERAAEVLDKMLGQPQEGDVFLTSPSPRALISIEPYKQLVRKRHGMKLTIQTDPLLRPISFGIWDNKSLEEIEAAYGVPEREKAAAYRDLNAVVKAGDRDDNFIAMLMQAYDFLTQTNREYAGRRVVASVHGTLSSAMLVLTGHVMKASDGEYIDWRHNMIPTATPFDLLQELKTPSMSLNAPDVFPVARSEMRKPAKGKSETVPSQKERLSADSVAKWIFVLLPWIACGGLVGIFGVIPWMWQAFAFAVPFGVIWSLFAYRAHPKTFEERMIAAGLQALVGTTLTLLVAVHYAAPISWYFYLKPLKENHQVAGLGIMEQASRWVYLNRNTKHFTLPGIIGQQFPGAHVIVVSPDQPYGTTLHEVLHEYMDRLSPEQLKTFQDLTRLGQQRNIEFMLVRPEWERLISIPNETTRQDLVRTASEEAIVEFVAKAAVRADDLNRNILSDGLSREEAERKLIEYIQGFREWNAHIGNINLDHSRFVAEPSPALKVWAMETFFPMIRVPFSQDSNLWGWYQAQLKTSMASSTPNTNSPAARSEMRDSGEREYALDQTVQGREAWIDRQLKRQDSRALGTLFTDISRFSPDAFDNVLDAMFRHFGLIPSNGFLKESIRPLRRDQALLASLLARSGRWNANQPFGRLITEAIHELEPGVTPGRETNVSFSEPAEIQNKSLSEVLASVKPWGRLSVPVRLTGQPVTLMGDHDFAYPVIRLAQNRNELPRKHLILINWDDAFHYDGARPEAIQAFEKKINEDPKNRDLFYRLSSSRQDQDAWEIRTKWLYPGSFIEALVLDGSVDDVVHVVASDWRDNKSGNLQLGVRQLTVGRREVRIIRARPGELISILRQLDPENHRSAVQSIDYDHFVGSSGGRSRVEPGRISDYRAAQEKLQAVHSPALVLAALSTPSFTPAELVPEISEKLGLDGGDLSPAHGGFPESAGYRPEALEALGSAARSEMRPENPSAVKNRVDEVIEEILRDWDKIVAEGAFVFDVDKTLLAKSKEKELNLDDVPQLRDLLIRLLQKNVHLAIISGNYSEVQKRRIIMPLTERLHAMGQVHLLKNLMVYSDGGAFRHIFQEKDGGMVPDEDYAGKHKIPVAVLNHVSDALVELGKRGFWLDGKTAEERVAWIRAVREHYESQMKKMGAHSPKFELPWTDTAATYTPSSIDADVLHRPGSPIQAPFIEIRDGVQLAIKRLPKKLVVDGQEVDSDIRSRVIENIQRHLGELAVQWYLNPTGDASIDFNQRAITKAYALQSFISAAKRTPKYVYYFGDEFYLRKGIPGNDVATAEVPEVNLIAVNELHAGSPETLDPSVQGRLRWIGEGPSAVTALFDQTLARRGESPALPVGEEVPVPAKKISRLPIDDLTEKMLLYSHRELMHSRDLYDHLDAFDKEHYEFVEEDGKGYWRSKDFPKLILGTWEDIEGSPSPEYTRMKHDVVIRYKNPDGKTVSFYYFHGHEKSLKYGMEAAARGDLPMTGNTQVFIDPHHDEDIIPGVRADLFPKDPQDLKGWGKYPFFWSSFSFVREMKATGFVSRHFHLDAPVGSSYFSQQSRPREETAIINMDTAASGLSNEDMYHREGRPLNVLEQKHFEILSSFLTKLARQDKVSPSTFHASASTLWDESDDLMNEYGHVELVRFLARVAPAILLVPEKDLPTDQLNARVKEATDQHFAATRSEMRGKPAALNPLYETESEDASVGQQRDPVIAERNRILKEAGIPPKQLYDVSRKLHQYRYPNLMLEMLILAMREGGLYSGDPDGMLRVAQTFFDKVGGDEGVRDLMRTAVRVAVEQEQENNRGLMLQLLKGAVEALDMGDPFQGIAREILTAQIQKVGMINEETARNIPTEDLCLKYWHVFRITAAELDQLMRRPHGLKFPRKKAEDIAASYRDFFGIEPAVLGRIIVANPDVLYAQPFEIIGTLGTTKEETVAQLPLAVTLSRDKVYGHSRPFFKKKVVMFRELGIPADRILGALSSLSSANFPILKFIADHVRGKILLQDPANLVKLYNEVVLVFSQMTQTSLVDAVNGQGHVPEEIGKTLEKAIKDVLDQRMPGESFAKASKEDLKAQVFVLIEREASYMEVKLEESEKREVYKRVGDRYRILAADPAGKLPSSLDDLYAHLSKRPKSEALETLIRVLEGPVFDATYDVINPDALQPKINKEPRLAGIVEKAEEMARIFGVSPGILAEEEHFGWAVGMLAAVSPSQREQLAHKTQILKRFVKDESAMLWGLNSIREANLSVLEILAEAFPEHLRNSNDRELVRLYQLLATELENPTLATLLADAKKIRKKGMDYKAKLKPFLQRYLDALKTSGFKTAVPSKPDAAREVAPYEIPKAMDDRLTRLMSFWQGKPGNEDSILKSFFDVNADLLDLVLDILEGERAAKHVFTSATQIRDLNAAINKKVEKSEGMKVSAYIDAHAAAWQKDLRRKVREAIQETLDVRNPAKAGEELPRPQEHLRERGQKMLAAGMSPERINLAFSSVYDINPDFFDLVIKMALEKNRVFEAGNKIKNVDDQFKAYLKESGVSFPSLMKQPFKDWDRAVRQSLTLTIKSNSISRSESRGEADRQESLEGDPEESSLRWPLQSLEANIKTLRDDLEGFQTGFLTAKEISLQSLLEDFYKVREQWDRFKPKLLSVNSGRRAEIGGPITRDLYAIRARLVSLVRSRNLGMSFGGGLGLTVLIAIAFAKSLPPKQTMILLGSGTALLYAVFQTVFDLLDRPLIRYLQSIDFELPGEESDTKRSEMRDGETVQAVEKLSLEKLMERHSQAIEWILRSFEGEHGKLPPDTEDKDYLKIKVILDSRSTQEMLDAADKKKASALETLRTIAAEAATAEPDREAYYQGWKKRVDEDLAQYAKDEQEGTGSVWQVRELREAVRRFISDPENAAVYSEYIGKRDWVIGRLKEATFMRSLEEGDRKLGANFSSTAFLTKFFFTLLQKRCPPGELQTNLERGGMYADELSKNLRASWPRLEMSPAISNALRAYYLKAYVMQQTFLEERDGQRREVSLIGGHEVSLGTIVNAYGILRSLGMNDQEIYEFLEKALIDGRDSLTNFDRDLRKTVAQVIQEAVGGQVWMAGLREWDQKIGWLIRDDFFSDMLALENPEQQWAPGDFQAAATSAIRQPRGNYADYFKQRLQEHGILDPLNAGILSALRVYYLQTYLEHKKIATEEPVQPGTPATAAPARSLLGDQKIERPLLVHAYGILRSRGKSDQQIDEFLETALLAQRADIVSSDPGSRKSVSAVLDEALKVRSEMRSHGKDESAPAELREILERKLPAGKSGGAGLHENMVKAFENLSKFYEHPRYSLRVTVDRAPSRKGAVRDYEQQYGIPLIQPVHISLEYLDAGGRPVGESGFFLDSKRPGILFSRGTRIFSTENRDRGLRGGLLDLLRDRLPEEAFLLTAIGNDMTLLEINRILISKPKVPELRRMLLRHVVEKYQNLIEARTDVGEAERVDQGDHLLLMEYIRLSYTDPANHLSAAELGTTLVGRVGAHFGDQSILPLRVGPHQTTVIFHLISKGKPGQPGKSAESKPPRSEMRAGHLSRRSFLTRGAVFLAGLPFAAQQVLAGTRLAMSVAGRLEFNVSGPGLYQVESRPAIGEGDWSVREILQIDTSGSYQWQDPNDISQQSRQLYRLKQVHPLTAQLAAFRDDQIRALGNFFQPGVGIHTTCPYPIDVQRGSFRADWTQPTLIGFRAEELAFSVAGDVPGRETLSSAQTYLTEMHRFLDQLLRDQTNVGWRGLLPWFRMTASGTERERDEIAFIDNANLTRSMMTASGALLRSQKTHPELAGSITAARQKMKDFLDKQRPGFQAFYDPSTHLFRGSGITQGLNIVWTNGYSIDRLFSEYATAAAAVVTYFGIAPEAFTGLTPRFVSHTINNVTRWVPESWDGAGFQMTWNASYVKDAPTLRAVWTNWALAAMHECSLNGVPGIPTAGFNPDSGFYSGQIGLSFHETPDPIISTIGLLNPLDSLNELLFTSDPVAWRKSILTQLPALASVYGNFDSATYTGKVSTDIYVGVDHYASFLGLTGKQGESFKAFMEDTENPGGPLYTHYVDLLEQAPVKAYAAPFNQPFAAPPVIRTGPSGEVGTAPVSTDPLYSYVYFDHLGRLGNGDGSMTSLVNNGILSLVVFHSPAGWIGEGGTKVPLPRLYANYVRLKVRAPNATGTVSFKVELPGFFSGKKAFTFVASDLKDWKVIHLPLDAAATRMTYIAFSDLTGTPDIQFADLELKTAIQPAPSKAASLAVTDEKQIYYSRAARTAENLKAALNAATASTRSEARTKEASQVSGNREERVLGADLEAFLDGRAHEFYGERESVWGDRGIPVMVYWGGPILTSVTYVKGPEGRRIKLGDTQADIGKRVIRQLSDKRKDFDPQGFYQVVTQPSSEEYLGFSIVPSEARSEARPVHPELRSMDQVIAGLENWKPGRILKSERDSVLSRHLRVEGPRKFIVERLRGNSHSWMITVEDPAENVPVMFFVDDSDPRKLPLLKLMDRRSGPVKIQEVKIPREDLKLALDLTRKGGWTRLDVILPDKIASEFANFDGLPVQIIPLSQARSELRSESGRRDEDVLKGERSLAKAYERIRAAFSSSPFFTLSDYRTLEGGRDKASASQRLEALQFLGLLELTQGKGGTYNTKYWKVTDIDPAILRSIDFALMEYESELDASEVKRHIDGFLGQNKTGAKPPFVAPDKSVDYQKLVAQLQRKEAGVLYPGLFILFDLILKHFGRSKFKAALLGKMFEGEAWSESAIKDSFRRLRELGLFDATVKGLPKNLWVQLRPLTDLQIRQVRQALLRASKTKKPRTLAYEINLILEGKLIPVVAPKRLLEPARPEETAPKAESAGVDAMPAEASYVRLTFPILVQAVHAATQKIQAQTGDPAAIPKVKHVLEELQMILGRLIDDNTLKNFSRKCGGMDMRRLGISGMMFPQDRSSLEILIDEALLRMRTRSANPDERWIPIHLNDLADEVGAHPQVLRGFENEGKINFSTKGVYVSRQYVKDRSQWEKGNREWIARFLRSIHLPASNPNIDFVLGQEKAWSSAETASQKRILSVQGKWRAELAARREADRQHYPEEVKKKVVTLLEAAIGRGHIKEIRKILSYLKRIDPNYPVLESFPQLWQRLLSKQPLQETELKEGLILLEDVSTYPSAVQRNITQFPQIVRIAEVNGVTVQVRPFDLKEKTWGPRIPLKKGWLLASYKREAGEIHMIFPSEPLSSASPESGFARMRSEVREGQPLLTEAELSLGTGSAGEKILLFVSKNADAVASSDVLVRSEIRKDVTTVSGAEIERAADLLLAGNILSDTQKGKGRDFWVRKLQQTIGRHLAGESYHLWLGYFQAAVGTPDRARELIRIFESLGFQFAGKPEFSLGGALGIPSPDMPVPESSPQGYREMRAAALGLAQRNQYAQAVEIAEQFLLIPDVPAKDRDQMRMALGEWALYARQHQKAIDVIAPMAANPGILPDKKGALYYILGAARSGLGFQNRQELVLRQAIQDLRTADEFLVPTESTWTPTTILLFANIHNQLGTIYTNLAPTVRQARGMSGFREMLDLARQEYERLLIRAGLSLDDFRGQGFGSEAFGDVFAGIMHKLEINETNPELLAKALRQKGLFVTTFIGLVRSVVDREQDEEGHMTLDRNRLILMSNLLAFAMAFRPQGVYLMYIDRYLAQLTFNLYLRETGDRVLLEEAERKFRGIVRLGETQPEAEGVAASDYVWLGDVLMEKARVLDPSDAGQNETATGFRREAVSRFQAALRRNPEHALAQRRLASIAQRFPGLSPRSETRKQVLNQGNQISDSAKANSPQRAVEGHPFERKLEQAGKTVPFSAAGPRSEIRNVFSLKEPVVFSIEAGDLAELKNWPELLATASFNPRKLFVFVTGKGNARSEARAAELSHYVPVLGDEQFSRLPKTAPIFHFGNMAENADAVREQISVKLGRNLRALLGIAPGSFLLPGLLLDEQVADAVLSRRGGFLFDDGRFTGRFLEVLFQSFEIISSAA